MSGRAGRESKAVVRLCSSATSSPSLLDKEVNEAFDGLCIRSQRMTTKDSDQRD